MPHRLVVAGRFESDLDRVATDLALICTTQIEFFGRPAPFDRYWFLGLAVGEGYGGLEHRASTSLIFGRDDLPKAGDVAQSREYQRFLALASHEYFHTWHVKRTKPAAFTLLDSSKTAKGVTIARYRRAGAVATGDFTMHPPTPAEVARREKMKKEG